MVHLVLQLGDSVAYIERLLGSAWLKYHSAASMVRSLNHIHSPPKFFPPPLGWECTSSSIYGGCRHDMYTPNGPSCAGATHALVAMSSRAGTPGRGILWLGRGKTPGQVQAGRLRGLCLQLSSGPGPEHHYDESLAGTRGAAHAILPTLPPSTASVYGGCCLLW